MERIYQKLNDSEKVEHYHNLWTKLNEATEKAFWNGTWYNTYKKVDDCRLFRDAQLTQALMICSGAVPTEKLPIVRELLKNDRLPPVTLSHGVFKYDAIMTDPSNKKWMLDDIAEIWGNMLFNGATTFRNTANRASDFKNAGSLCHGWSAVPLHLYHKYGME